MIEITGNYFRVLKRDAVKKTAIVKDPIYFEHKTGDYHPESPERLVVVYEMLERDDMVETFETLRPRKATKQEIELIHTSSHFERIAATAGLPSLSFDPDTPISERSFEAALFAVGGILLGIEKIMGGDVENVFALVRPPGHHAEADRAMGFCLFNNIAIGVMYAIKKYSLDRILVVDWDLHHGNGTQHSFSADNRVLYFSTHQFPHYPGTGDFSEVGEGKGRGFTINVPLQAGRGDDDYRSIFKRILEPVADLFKPQLVLVSAGFDIYFDDPLGGMKVTHRGFAALTQMLMHIAERHAGGRLLLTLEGGYHLQGLREGVRAVLQRLTGEDSKNYSMDINETERESEYVIEKTASIQKEFWSCF